MNCHDLREGASRRKTIPIEVYNLNPIHVKNSIDIILLAIGTSLGYGFYFVVGSVARITGPAAVISITVAGLSAILAAICYLEFIYRLPKASSPYFYAYIQINEIMAFTFGWNMILEYVTGVASFGRGLSRFLKFIIFHEEQCESYQELFSCHYDYLAVVIILVATLIYTWGVTKFPKVNDIITVANIIAICVIFVAGYTLHDVSNWSLKPTNITAITGDGGFMPFGSGNILYAAAKYFYLFIGFGSMTVSAEQIKNPGKKFPVALGTCLFCIYVFYMLLATCLTMMVPYYTLDRYSPITEAFDRHNMTIIKWLVVSGAILAITNQIFCCQIPVTRTVYTMGVDCLISRCLGKLNEKTRTPANAIVFCGCVSAISALLFDVEALIELTSLGTLWIRCISAIFIITIHYRPVKEVSFVNVTCWRIFKQLVIYSDFDDPNLFTTNVVFYATMAFTVLSIMIALLLSYSFLLENLSGSGQIAICALIIYLMIHVIVLITRQPKPVDNIKFKVPCSPLLPCFSILLNIVLMIHLHVLTWVRFITWMTLGFLIYFCYGIKQSAELTGSHRSMIDRHTQYEENPETSSSGVAPRDSTMFKNVEEMERVVIDLDTSKKHSLSSENVRN